MKRFGLTLLFWGACVAATHGNELLRELPPEKFRAAGLHKLTQEELVQLELIVAGQRTAATKPVEPDTKKGPSWLRALATLQEVAAKPDAAEALESTLAGDYDGLSGRNVFRLQNGQVWQQIDSTSRIDDKRSSPRVKIYPGVLGAYWLEIEGINQRVKVKPVKLQ